MERKSGATQIIRIKNMVCPRCILVVTDTLQKLGYGVLKVELGKATVSLTKNCFPELLQNELEKLGFELLHEKLDLLTEDIKLAIIEIIYSGKISNINTTLSIYLEEKLGKDYATLNQSFKAVTGRTIGSYIIQQKVVRAKELLQDNEVTVAAISNLLGYRSVQYFSNQFKAATGFSPSQFRQEENVTRPSICDIL